MLKDLSLSNVTAGLVAVLVGYTSSVAIVFQAAQASGADAAKLSSWMWALGWGMGLGCVLPSLWLKRPVMMAWSTPGAAVLAVSAQGFGMEQAVGAFLFSGALVTLCGVTGWFEKALNRIPMALASALLAGVLAKFALNGFKSAEQALALAIGMLACFLILRRWLPRYAVPITFAVGMLWALLEGRIDSTQIRWALATPVWTTPSFDWQALISLGVPLFVVTMASQNLPGVAAIRNAGYQMPISALITISGVITLALAPFGGYAINLAAITAAICLGPQAHADPDKRYVAAVVCGLAYIVLGIMGGSVAGLISAVPPVLVLMIAALALLATISSGLVAAMREDASRDAALLTFLVTMSGVTIAGIGSAFWGVVAGLCALGLNSYGRSGTAR